MTRGRLGKVVLAVRCSGILIRTVNPSEADGVKIRARANHSGAFDARPWLHTQPISDIPCTLFDVTEKHFQDDVVGRPHQCGQMVVVQSHGCPAMRYAAAGLYSREAHVVMSNDTFDASMAALKIHLGQTVVRRAYGIIIDLGGLCSDLRHFKTLHHLQGWTRPLHRTG